MKYVVVTLWVFFFLFSITLMNYSYAEEIVIGNNMCLDMTQSPAGYGGNGKEVIAWQCHGGQNQQWEITKSGLIRTKDNMCLDMTQSPAGYGGNGKEVIAWQCHGELNQQWKIR